MIKSDQITFKELPPPILSRVLTISQPEQELISEHWRGLMAVIEIESGNEKEKERSTYLLYKAGCHVAFANFQEGCLLYQRKFKILYGQIQEITCIKLHLITLKLEDLKRKEVLVAVGFHDGSLELYNLMVTEKSVVLRKLLFLDNSGPKQPVTGVAFHKKSLFIARAHQLVMYRDFLAAIASIIISDQGKEKLREIYYKFLVQTLPLDSLALGTTISITPGASNLYVYNETEGARSIDFETLKPAGTIIDSLVAVREASGNNILLGDAANYLKVIYGGMNYVERYRGFKNYCSAIENVLFPQHEEVWVGDLNGCLTYFQRHLAPPPSPPPKTMRMVEHTIKYSLAACPHGVKDLRVSGRLLFLLDSESNIHVYDIIRKDALEHLKTVELESVEEYSCEG